MKKILYPMLKRPQRGGAKKQTRHTHPTVAAIEDALAVQWDIIFELTEALKYAEGRARRTIDILKVLRKGPHAYDPEQQSGKKIIIKKR